MKSDPNRFYSGGCWYYPSSSARVTYSVQDTPSVHIFYLGIRLVRHIEPLQQIAEVEYGK